MRIFISWSGERSRLVGELLNDWIRRVLQAVDPWISSNDIDRGSLWFTEINEKLKEVSIGIICLTAENKDKPWILFEAGALLKGLSTNRVCTILIDLKPNDIKDPLAQFNHTIPDRDGLRKLVRTLNLALGERSLSDKVLDDVFETYYPKFKSEFDSIIQTTPETTPVIEREQDDVLNEILTVVRGVEKRVRGLEKDSFENIETKNFNWATSGTKTGTSLEVGGLVWEEPNQKNGVELSTFLNGIRGDKNLRLKLNKPNSSPEENK